VLNKLEEIPVTNIKIFNSKNGKAAQGTRLQQGEECLDLRVLIWPSFGAASGSP
jgi:hypothetical protein